jgi:hypothetical protein
MKVPFIFTAFLMCSSITEINSNVLLNKHVADHAKGHTLEDISYPNSTGVTKYVAVKGKFFGT